MAAYGDAPPAYDDIMPIAPPPGSKPVPGYTPTPTYSAAGAFADMPPPPRQPIAEPLPRPYSTPIAPVYRPAATPLAFTPQEPPGFFSFIPPRLRPYDNDADRDAGGWHSRTTLFGWPLFGVGGKPRAIFALGGMPTGWFSIGWISFGWCFGFGQIGVGVFLMSVGQLSASFGWAIGQLALGFMAGLGQLSTGIFCNSMVQFCGYCLIQAMQGKGVHRAKFAMFQCEKDG
eukprot:c32273_g1_i1.p1 GENE.c32273_g1_i1~~c32273_g1_i1.p1  ORF type:complete len:244 (+),score=21.60 c32273_g1_i1:43-732(+)